MMSEAATWGAIGGGAVALALAASLAERRRMRRSDLDAVGWVPWTAIFIAAVLVASVALGLAARAWFVGPAN